MTYNVQYCYDRVKTILPDRTAARIIAENPDFCCLNEVRDSEDHPEATLLAKMTGLQKTHFGAGSQGNLLLSREAPAKTVHYELPYVNYSRHLGISEFSNMVVAVTHLDVSGTAKEKRLESIARIKELFAAFASGGKPVFLCGDWNCGPDTDEIAAMNAFMTILSPTNGVRTYHAHSATGGGIIDYIAVDTVHADALFLARSFVVEDIDTSDHNPVITEIHLRPAAAGLGWMDERFLTTGRTGTWAADAAWNARTWTMDLVGVNVFTPAVPSGGKSATITVTVVFDAVPDEEMTPGADAQGAVWLGTDGRFQVWTKTGGGTGDAGMGWLPVVADGVTPTAGVEYTFRFVFDYRKGRYAVSVLYGSGWRPLAAEGAAGATAFPLAVPGVAVSRVTFDGVGDLRALCGETGNARAGFVFLLK
jgi:endonuclease/exonuclease/phosphatase family metal-dependent hydrolase